ncbi:T9SS type A sorting domain-containing protein [Dyadobacter sp. CY261]|uniref:T9SS type A sorting domain-containing protein n=1 Tax=Dyadobacter sp. CY261 TaxID=2907203 RepID=UPI001F2F49FA|nr:T9SS type A sorting domain-containing protein [Dyadobacter sp. CY261]MCF0072386.1 T9SS type A sorting domain-containing protein [Dyadobacter sp. CY261]
MKTVSIQKLTWSLLLVAAPAFLSVAQAQSDKKPKSEDQDKKTSIRIKVTEDENGKTRDIERSYEVGAMTDTERQKFVDKVLDSLKVDKKKKQTISITVDDGNDGAIAAKKRKKVIIDHRDPHEPMAFHWDSDFKYDMDWDSDKFRENIKTIEKNFNKDFHPKAKILMREMEDFGKNFGKNFDYEWDNNVKSANVRSLTAYANNPADDVLNLRFSVPEKGNVTVTVTDTKGKEVGKKEIHDFEGEYVGQIELKKNTKGTLFVTVVQNEDGAVKRVVIP